MQDSTNPGSPPRSSSLFDTSFSKPPMEHPAPRVPPAPERSKGMRLILPIALFVAAISGLAWIAQYLPNWRASKAEVSAPPKPVPSTVVQFLKFGEMFSAWDPDDPKYVREYERGQEGFYDYHFTNTSDGVVELGLIRTSCDCSRVDIAVFSPSDPGWKKYQEEKKPTRVKTFPAGAELKWVPPAMDERKGIDVPAGHRGIVRISWKGKKADGEQLRLTTFLWAQPKNREREFPALETQVVMMPAVRFIQDAGGSLLPGERVSMGILAARDIGRASFFCWSSTRDKLKLSKDPMTANGPAEYVIEPVSETEALALEKKLRDAAINTRILTAYRVQVKMHELKMDQGPFQTSLPLVYDGVRLEGGPVITGHVRGDVQIASTDSGKIELPTFLVKDGVRQVVPLVADANVELTYDSHYPSFLEVKLEKDRQASSAGRSRWNVEVRIPPGYAQPGLLPRESAVILRMSGPNSRIIRIPVTGNAVQG